MVTSSSKYSKYRLFRVSWLTHTCTHAPITHQTRTYVHRHTDTYSGLLSNPVPDLPVQIRLGVEVGVQDNVAVARVEPAVVALVQLHGVEVLNLPHGESSCLPRLIGKDFIVLEVWSLQCVQP